MIGSHRDTMIGSHRDRMIGSHRDWGQGLRHGPGPHWHGIVRRRSACSWTHTRANTRKQSRLDRSPAAHPGNSTFAQISRPRALVRRQHSGQRHVAPGLFVLERSQSWSRARSARSQALPGTGRRAGARDRLGRHVAHWWPGVENQRQIQENDRKVRVNGAEQRRGATTAEPTSLNSAEPASRRSDSVVQACIRPTSTEGAMADRQTYNTLRGDATKLVKSTSTLSVALTFFFLRKLKMKQNDLHLIRV